MREGDCVTIRGYYREPNNKTLYIKEQVKSPIKKSNDIWYSCIEQESSKEYVLPLCFLKQYKN